MPAVGEPAGEDGVVEVGGDRVGDDDSAHRHVPRVDALREGDQVRGHVVAVEREPASGTTEPGHDLVENEHDSVAIAQLTHPGQVAGGWQQYACGSRNGFEQHRGDAGGALALDDALEVPQGALALLLRTGRPELAAVEVRPEEVRARPAAPRARHPER